MAPQKHSSVTIHALSFFFKKACAANSRVKRPNYQPSAEGEQGSYGEHHFDR